MNTKLTLNLNKLIIEKAKSYAKKNQTSLSKLIEGYLESVTRKPSKQDDVSPLVESLTGIIPDVKSDRDEYRDYLSKKYS